MNHKQEATGHQYENGGVIRISSAFKPWELIMSQLNNRNFKFVINVGKSISLEVNGEFEDTKSPWSLKLIAIGWRSLVLLYESILVVWVQHHKLELDIICNVWNPLSILLFMNINEVFNIDFSLVVLWVGSIPLIS